MENNSENFSGLDFDEKHFFIGISISNSSQYDSGIAIINKDLELIRIDKFYRLNEIKDYLEKFSCKKSSIICVDLPKNAGNLTGKWRIEAKYNKTFNVGGNYNSTQDWSERFSDRGADLCENFKKDGFDIFRYNCFFTKNILGLSPPCRSRSSNACKALQSIIKEKLGIYGFPSNMIPASGLDSVIGAYIARSAFLNKQNNNCKIISQHKDLPVLSTI